MAELLRMVEAVWEAELARIGCVRAPLYGDLPLLHPERVGRLVLTNSEAYVLAGQIDPRNNRATADALPGLKRFNQPTLIIWGADDPHFGPEWAEKLRRDIAGAVRVELLQNTGHLLMEERPQELAAFVLDFLQEND